MTPILTGPIVANLVRMSRQVEKNKAALLIEGDKDARVYRKVIDTGSCRYFVAGNRANAESALAELKRTREKGVLAVVDADTDHLDGRASREPNLIITHTRDVEGVLLSSPVLQNVLVEYDLDPHLLGPQPEKAAVEAAKELGYLRWLEKTRLELEPRIPRLWEVR